MNHISLYLQDVQSALASVPLEDVERVADLLWANYRERRRVVFCGNGGSAATASHLPADLQKNMTLHGDHPWECLSIVDSVPLLTAWGNDTEFANIFAGQARVWLRPGDLLLAISGSGNSPNVLAAVEAARECGAVSVGLCGYGGGKLAALSDYSIVLASTNMQVVEDVHMMLGHALYVALRERVLAQEKTAMPDAAISELWQRYEAWLAMNAPHLVSALRPGAEEEDIRHAEDVCGLRFPDDFRASLRVHNGQDPEADSLVPGGEMLSTSRIEDEWDIWNDLYEGEEFVGMDATPRGPVRAEWWNPKWIPFTSNGGGDSECLDLDPAPSGVAGQIVELWHELDWRPVIAASFTDWLTDLVEGCEAGRYVYSAEDREIVEDDGL